MTETGVIRYCLVCSAKRKLFWKDGRPFWECGHLQDEERQRASLS